MFLAESLNRPLNVGTFQSVSSTDDCEGRGLFTKFDPVFICSSDHAMIHFSGTSLKRALTFSLPPHSERKTPT